MSNANSSVSFGVISTDEVESVRKQSSRGTKWQSLYDALVGLKDGQAITVSVSDKDIDKQMNNIRQGLSMLTKRANSGIKVSIRKVRHDGVEKICVSRK